MDLEATAAKADKDYLEGSDDDSDVMEDDELAQEEGKMRGRKRGRKFVEAEDNAMEVDGVFPKKSHRSTTAPGIKRAANSRLRTLSQGRREGSEPPRNPIKMETAESIRLGKKITHRAFKHAIEVNEADRHIAVKKPKHLFSGKMGKGASNKR